MAESPTEPSVSPDAENRPATIVIQTRVRPGQHEAYADWQGRMRKLASRQPGFLDSEVLPPIPGEQDDWVIVENFARSQDAVAWLQTDERSQMRRELKPMLAWDDSINILIGDEQPPRADTTVTAVITSRVVQGREKEFLEWHERIGRAQAGFPGYLGAELQPPIDGVNTDWVTLLRFDNGEHLRAWLDSPECAALKAEGEPYMERSEYRMARSSFESWFPNDTVNGKPPPSWKLSAIVMLVLYPVIMVIRMFIFPHIIAPLGLGPTTFVTSILSVAATGFVLIPLASRALRWWLVPPPGKERRNTWIGIAGILVAYALSVLLMSLLAELVLPAA